MAIEGGAEMAHALTGTFTATGQSPTFGSAAGCTNINITLTGTGVASIQLEKSFDTGATWSGIFAGGTQLYQWSYTGTNLSETAGETEKGVLYRLNCTAYTSGTINYRLSQ